MGYRKAKDVLPHSLLNMVQRYVDGAYLYIPRKADAKKPWGANTGGKERVRRRNSEIMRKRRAGQSASALAEEYFLSVKTVHKIIAAMKRG